MTAEAQAAVAIAPRAQKDLDLFKKTKEFEELAKRKGVIQLEPIHERVFGGLAIWGDIPDKHGNIIYDGADQRNQPQIGMFGEVLQYDNPKDQRLIYAIFNCPCMRSKIVLKDEKADKMTHRFRVVDLEAEGIEYATAMKEDVTYKNKIFGYDEDMVNFLCIVCKLDTNPSQNIKHAALCKIWDAGSKSAVPEAQQRRATLKKMMDSPEVRLYQIAYLGVKAGDPLKAEGFYKTGDGVYKFNEVILGTSIEHVVAYLRTHDDICVAYATNLLKAEKRTEQIKCDDLSADAKPV